MFGYQTPVKMFSKRIDTIPQTPLRKNTEKLRIFLSEMHVSHFCSSEEETAAVHIEHPDLQKYICFSRPLVPDPTLFEALQIQNGKIICQTLLSQTCKIVEITLYLFNIFDVLKVLEVTRADRFNKNVKVLRLKPRL